MSKKNIILYSLAIIIAVVLVFYLKVTFFDNNILIDNEVNEEDSLILNNDEPITTEPQEGMSRRETQEKTLTEKEVDGIKYKISLKMESEQGGEKVIFYDVVSKDIVEEEIKIMAKKIVQDVLSEEETEKIVLFFHKNESLLGVRFNAEVTWTPDTIIIEIVE